MTILSLPELGADLRPIPRDAEGPVFKAPWEAQVFVFTWPQWAEALSAAIVRAQSCGDPDLGDTYYLHWVSALEVITLERGLADAVQLASLAEAIADDARHHREIQLAGGHPHHHPH